MGEEAAEDMAVTLPEAMTMGSVGPKVVKVKGPPVLPWMRSPVEIGAHEPESVSEVPLLDPRLREALQEAGIEALFPVQVAVWNQVLGPGGRERDLCVCSPTGSGKTLSFALPIVQLLSTRVLRRLRALVVLPTRDLAVQVKSVFDILAPAVGLSVGLVGQSTVAAEAGELVKSKSRMIHSFGSQISSTNTPVFESCVDILVATPGRLMDHLKGTPGFTVEHLQYLVVDETDRLLRQDYQSWLPNVLQVIQIPERFDDTRRRKAQCLQGVGTVLTRRRWCLERGLKGRVHPRVMKFVLSATLTKDPAKIAQLDLYCPLYLAPSADENRYQLPKQLKAFKLMTKASKKSLVLVALLEQFQKQPTIIFNASVEATHQLFLLLRNFYDGDKSRVSEYSSRQPQHIRRKALADFMAGKVQVLVASDAMTRGMDVEGVANVINFDVPVYAKTYVHRVGRTARAGQAGRAFTLLVKKEARHFKKELLSKLENGACEDYELPTALMEELLPRLTAAQELLNEDGVAEGISKDGDSAEVLVAEPNT